MIVTISHGPHVSSQGELVSTDGATAKIRIGNRIVEGLLVTDLAARRREMSNQRREEIGLDIVNI